LHRDVQVSRSTGRARATLAANIPERKAEHRIREQARSYGKQSKPRFVGAALAANIPERKAEHRIREQARSYGKQSKPRFVGAALAANIPERKAEHRIREQARSYGKQSKPRFVGVTLAANIPERRASKYQRANVSDYAIRFIAWKTRYPRNRLSPVRPCRRYPSSPRRRSCSEHLCRSSA